MHDLNDALDELRSVIPYAHSPSVRKLSKIATLLLAKNYILMQASALDEMRRLVGYMNHPGAAAAAAVAAAAAAGLPSAAGGPPPPSSSRLAAASHPPSTTAAFDCGLPGPYTRATAPVVGLIGRGPIHAKSSEPLPPPHNSTAANKPSP